MTITTEEAEWLADWVEEEGGLSLRAAGLRCLAAERDALKAEKVNLQDDLASAERERAHQHGRADRNAAEYAREQAKRDALQKRVAKLEALVKSAFTEGFNAGHEEGEELGEFTANGGDARRHESRGPIWHWQSSETKATLEGKKDE
ncbi:MAG: hypothetical protein ACK5PR_03035 [bacterium]